MKGVKVFLSNLFWFFYTIRDASIWRRATKNVAQTQNQYLMRLLESNKKTKFGLDHNFGEIKSIDSFQRNVPEQTYDKLFFYIRQIELGESNVLAREVVTNLGVSSGSTKASKLIPYSRVLFREFERGINVWINYLFKQYPKLLFGKSYWSITPINQSVQYSTGGTPIGFDDERIYFGLVGRKLWNTLQAVPTSISSVQDLKVFRSQTLLFLLKDRSLSWVSVWNPTFIILCLEPLREDMDSLIEDLESGLEFEVSLGRVRELKRIWHAWQGKSLLERNHQGKTFFECLWPNLRVISCWADGFAKPSVVKLKEYFPSVIIEPKGLVATEALISFPFRNGLSALSITSHFFEFSDMETREIKLAHELKQNRVYSVIVTTGGGLYRYELGDSILVKGFFRECPLIQFVGRSDRVVDIRGEKLNENFVREKLEETLSHLNVSVNFSMISPEIRGNISDDAYTLFVQFDSEVSKSELLDLRHKLENKLCENFHYSYCRNLGQLQELRLFLISSHVDANGVYIRVCNTLGQRLGDIKGSVLHHYTSWSEKFEGTFIT